MGYRALCFALPAFDLTVSLTDYTGKTDLDKIALLKNRQFVEIYRDLMVEKPLGSIFEIGFFQGGMPLFLADMAAPNKIVAVDWSPPSDELMTPQIARNRNFLPRSS